MINNTNDNLEVTIGLAFKNGTGSKKDARGGRWNESVTLTDGDVSVTGVLMHQRIQEMVCTVGLFGNVKVSFINVVDSR